jgi:hypothetical protein
MKRLSACLWNFCEKRVRIWQYGRMIHLCFTNENVVLFCYFIWSWLLIFWSNYWMWNFWWFIQYSHYFVTKYISKLLLIIDRQSYLLNFIVCISFLSKISLLMKYLTIQLQYFKICSHLSVVSIKHCNSLSNSLSIVVRLYTLLYGSQNSGQ